MKRILLAALLATVLIGLVGSAGSAAYLPIMLRGYTFDPLQGVPAVPQSLRAAAPAPDQPAYYLVQCTGPVLAGWKTTLTTAGAELLSYAPQYTFAVRMTPAEATAILGLPFVRWVGLYQPAYELSPTLPAGDGIIVSVVLWPGESTAPVEQALRALGATILASSPASKWPFLRAQVSSQRYADVARIKGVSWVEPWHHPEPCNNLAQQILDVSPPAAGVDGAYDVWNNAHLFGKGQVVAIGDTGLDTGDPATLSADFQGRLRGAIAYDPSGSWADFDGHGTHTAGSILGNGANSSSNPAAHLYTGSFAGMAPEAKLVEQSFGAGFNVPADLNSVFQAAYDLDARVHSNSWGQPFSLGEYDLSAMQTDQFAWGHPDMTIIFAAGNEGQILEPTEALRSPGTAKNIVTVGASESVRPEGGTLSDNPSGMADFSSRGPAADGRTKPDVSAPGTFILSCLSQVAPSFRPFDAFYQLMSGTSMSTPLTAGAAALVRDYFMTVQHYTPSAALIKAALMNTATEMAPGQYLDRINTPQQEITTRPNSVEGWGRVDVGAITYTVPGGRSIWRREGTSRGIYFGDAPNSAGISTGEFRDLWFYVVDSTHPFRATLAWTDYPGMLGAGKELVNDLDLQVRSPQFDGSSTILSTWLGSGQNPATTVQLGATTDRTNNVEGVDVPSPTPGWYRVRVIGFNVPQAPQGFALVVSASLVNTVTISGRVTEPVTGGGVAGVVIQVRSLTSGQAVASTITEQASFNAATGLSMGEWVISGLSPGFYEVRPVPPNLQTSFTPASRTFTVSSEDITDLNFEVAASFIVNGHVTTVGGQPIPNVLVRVFDPTNGFEAGRATTNKDGYYEVNGLARGNYVVIATKTGVGIDPEEGWAVTLPEFIVPWIPYATRDFVGGVPYPTYYVWGFVKTPQGVSVPGVTLRVTGGGQFRGGPVSLVGTTGPDGYYAIGGLPRGGYRIDGEKTGYGVHPILSDGKPAVVVSHTFFSVFMVGAHVDWQAIARDLAVTSVTVDGNVLVSGRPAALFVKVQNFSPEAASNVAVTASFFNGQSNASQTIPLLAGKTSQTLTFNFTAPSSPVPGTITVQVAPLPGEVNTGNNAQTINVQVLARGLSNGEVVPTTGTTNTQFQYRVIYTDLTKVAPQEVWAAVRLLQTQPTWLPMSALDPSDTNYADGKTYAVSTFLTQGTGAFRFALKVQDQWIYWPQPTGTYRTGPTVFPPG